MAVVGFLVAHWICAAIWLIQIAVWTVWKVGEMDIEPTPLSPPADRWARLALALTVVVPVFIDAAWLWDTIRNWYGSVGFGAGVVAGALTLVLAPAVAALRLVLISGLAAFCFAWGCWMHWKPIPGRISA